MIINSFEFKQHANLFYIGQNKPPIKSCLTLHINWNLHILERILISQKYELLNNQELIVKVTITNSSLLNPLKINSRWINKITCAKFKQEGILNRVFQELNLKKDSKSNKIKRSTYHRV